MNDPDGGASASRPAAGADSLRRDRSTMSSLEAVVRMLAAVSAVLLVWIPADPLVVLGVLALGVGVSWRHVTTKVTDSSQRTGAWAARGPLGVLGVWALIALLADIDAVT